MEEFYGNHNICHLGHWYNYCQFLDNSDFYFLSVYCVENANKLYSILSRFYGNSIILVFNNFLCINLIIAIQYYALDNPPVFITLMHHNVPDWHTLLRNGKKSTRCTPCNNLHWRVGSDVASNQIIFTDQNHPIV